MKKTFKRMVTCIFSALLTVNSVMPAYANEQPISEPLSSTLNVSVIGSGQVKVTENGNETVVTTETPFSQSYAEGTNVKIEAIATEGNVIENFTNNDVAVPEFVAEQNNLKIEYVTGVENSNFVVTFKEIVSSEEQETNEKVDTEPIEQPEAEGETTKEDSIETEEKDKTKDKVDKNSKLLINDETFIPNRPVSAEEQQILNDYQNGMTMKEEYIQKRKEIVDKIHAWKYVDDNYFITAKFYEDYDTANLLLGLGASILIAPDFRYSESASSTYSSDRSLSSPVVTYFEEGGHTSISNGIGSVWGTGGFWKVDGHVAFCGEAMYAPPRAGMTLNSAVEVHDDRVRKVIYYAYGYPNNQVSNTFPNRDQALLAMNEFLSAVASGTSISGSANGQRYHVAYESLKGILNLPSPPSDFKVYKAKCPGTGVSWQGIVTQNQTLYWGQNEPKGNLTIEKSSANPSITDNNNCYSLEGAEYGLYNSEAYAPLIQQRIRLKMRLPLHTGSLIQVSSDIKSGNGIESEYINRIMKEGDQVDCFLNYIDEMIEMDEKAGKYLKYKLVDELTDEEIALKLGISRRALYGIKPNAYFRIAIWSHQVAYIKESTYEFIFNYAGLYERLK